MVLTLGNKDPKVLPEQISSKKEKPKLLYIVVKKDGNITVNKAQDPIIMQPTTLDLKKATTKKALPQLSGKKARLLE
ncbi:hypothetical protein M8C21_026038 [Ambrosia artemisiifolia]|uniref:Uncharacterized protein n=1 Tax=Ambrosia artemisiifolia TaxID=4212 RepID=A0AAD5D6D2_AMBAR|nr:hypothetical protein M8C21_026038 [Ambrosia artemisiifolia]